MGSGLWRSAVPAVGRRGAGGMVILVGVVGVRWGVVVFGG